MVKTVALVQARMGSSRFPGKMLAKLGERPILEWVLQRVRRATMIDSVVLATTKSSQDDELVAFVHGLGIEVFRGSEGDVLGRFAAAASHYGAETVVRVCADNPFIDPDELDRLVSHFKMSPCDYSFNHQSRLGSGHADGFGGEILSNGLLQKIAHDAIDVRHREHATLYIWENLGEFHVSAVPAKNHLENPEMRFDVDSPDDLAYLDALFRAGVCINSSAEEIIQIALNSGRERPVTSDTHHARGWRFGN